MEECASGRERPGRGLSPRRTFPKKPEPTTDRTAPSARPPDGGRFFPDARFARRAHRKGLVCAASDRGTFPVSVVVPGVRSRVLRPGLFARGRNPRALHASGGDPASGAKPARNEGRRPALNRPRRRRRPVTTPLQLARRGGVWGKDDGWGESCLPAFFRSGVGPGPRPLSSGRATFEAAFAAAK